MHEQPILKGKIRLYGDFTNTELLGSRGLYLPSGVGVAKDEQDFVIQEVMAFFQKV